MKWSLVVVNHLDEISWMRFLTFWERIGEITASKYIANLLNKENINECIQYLSEIESQQVIYQVLQVLSQNISQPQNAIKEAFKLMQERFQVKYKNDWRRRVSDFDVLEILGSKYSSFNDLITECLLDNSTLMESSISDSKKGGVILSTVHSAKGLEAETCFVVNVSPSQFPCNWIDHDNIDEVEEERRVLYVALTRAKNELILTRDITTITSLKDSDKTLDTYFLNELPDGLVTQEVLGNSDLNVQDIDILNEIPKEFGVDLS